MTGKQSTDDIVEQTQSAENTPSDDLPNDDKEKSRHRFIRDIAMVTDGVLGGFFV